MLPTATLRQLCQQAGFDLIGFARAEPIPPDDLYEWLESGCAADMDWMGTRAAERLDVSKLLPGAKTVVAFAINYYREDPGTADSPIALYARGRDYHSTLRDKLKAFRKGVSEAWPEVQHYGSVDSGPLMEKVWAARAGLGYVGRNGCFITEPYGSWVLLAALILDAEVDEYAGGPTADRCGHCRKCILSCPTGALLGDSRVDARACLSYQTIENRHGEGNQIIGNRLERCKGIRIQDARTLVANNVLVSLSKGGRGFQIMGGSAAWDVEIQGKHPQAAYTLLRGNSGPMIIGHKYSQFTLPAINTKVESHSGAIKLGFQVGTILP